MTSVFFCGLHRAGAAALLQSASFRSLSSQQCTTRLLLQSPASLTVSPLMRFASTTAAVSAKRDQQMHNHATHWRLERIMDVALLPLVPIAFYTDNVVANYLLIIITAAHTHWGMEAIVVDYMRPRVVGKIGYWASMGMLYILSFATMAGLLYLNYTQMPPTKAIKKLWTL